MALPARHTPPVPAAQPDSPLAVIVRVTNEGREARHCALIVSDVAEVMRPLPIEGVAHMPAFVLGLSLIRGTPIPVVDAAALLAHGREHRPLDEEAVPALEKVVPTRFVVVRAGDRRVALAVQGVLGVRPLARETLRALPPLLANAGAQVVTALGTLDAQLLTVLSGGYLVPPALWEALATPQGVT